jgi:hypothetical protein
LLPEFGKGAEAGAVVVRTVPGKTRIVWNRDRRICGEIAIVFYDYDAGAVRDGLPYPIIISIQIDGKEIKALGDSIFLEERDNGFCADPLLMDREIGGNRRDKAIHHETLPTITNERCPIALDAIPTTKFDQVAMGGTDGLKEGFEKAILSTLTPMPVFEALKIKKRAEGSLNRGLVGSDPSV